MYKFITVLGILAMFFLSACERQEQRPAEQRGGTEQTQPRETPATPSQQPGQTQEQAPGQQPGQQPGTAPGQAPAGEQR